MDTTSRLKSVFASALALPQTTAFESLAYQGIPEWDSVAHMQLVSAIEADFDVMFATEDVLDMSSFPKALEILKKHGVAIDS